MESYPSISNTRTPVSQKVLGDFLMSHHGITDIGKGNKAAIGLRHADNVLNLTIPRK